MSMPDTRTWSLTLEAIEDRQTPATLSFDGLFPHPLVREEKVEIAPLIENSVPAKFTPVQIELSQVAGPFSPFKLTPFSIGPEPFIPSKLPPAHEATAIPVIRSENLGVRLAESPQLDQLLRERPNDAIPATNRFDFAFALDRERLSTFRPMNGVRFTQDINTVDHNEEASASDTVNNSTDQPSVAVASSHLASHSSHTGVYFFDGSSQNLMTSPPVDSPVETGSITHPNGMTSTPSGVAPVPFNRMELISPVLLEWDGTWVKPVTSHDESKEEVVTPLTTASISTGELEPVRDASPITALFPSSQPFTALAAAELQALEIATRTILVDLPEMGADLADSMVERSTWWLAGAGLVIAVVYTARSNATRRLDRVILGMDSIHIGPEERIRDDRPAN